MPAESRDWATHFAPLPALFAPPILAPHRFDPSSNKYTPYGKEWIKKQVFEHLRMQAG